MHVQFVPWPLVPASAPKAHTRLRFGVIAPGVWGHFQHGKASRGLLMPLPLGWKMPLTVWRQLLATV